MRISMADWQVTDKQKELINEVLDSGRLTYGEKTKELERQFAQIHGVKYALFTSSGTAALKISLHALKDKYGWQDGDEVIIPAVTFVATMNVVLMNNLTPVIVDVNQFGNLDPFLIEEAITDKTRAILPVHLLGQPADMEAILQIAKKRNLLVVEDSCETMFVNKVQGDIACFSSYVAHLLVTGVGGFITTNDEKLATVMRSMMFHGRDESYLNMDDTSDLHRKFFFPRFGYSDRMTELEAALGLGELVKWKEIVKQRQENADYLQQHLGRKGVGLWSPVSPPDSNTDPSNAYSRHAFMFFPVEVIERDAMAKHLEENGIDSRLMMPLTTQPTVKPYLIKDYPFAEHFNKHGLLLPCHQYLTKEDLDYMIEKIKEFYGDE